MIEKRQYVRMNTVFPVEFQVCNGTGKEGTSRLLQGFTRDVSAGGMCIEFKNFGNEEKTYFIPNAVISLSIDTTFAKSPIRAAARIVWLKEEETHSHPKYCIGIAYTHIDDKARRRIIKHAKRLIWVPRIAFSLGLLGVVLLGGLSYNNHRLVVQNQQLVHQLVEGAEKKSSVASELYELQKRRSRIDGELQKAQENVKRLEKSITSLNTENISQKTAYEKHLKKSLEKQKTLGTELESLREGREKLKQTYQDLEKSGELTASAALRQMYEWLKSHQNLRTGLVASFEGDASLEDWAFTYDQSLACQTFLLFGDVKNAEMILNFYDKTATQQEGGFFNTYHAQVGDPVESTIHSGPNIWVGIAALQYQDRVKDGRFLSLAKRIGEWVITLQDSEGGLRGGPGLRWYSTEHNLDAYAFFSMLYSHTQDEKYRQAQEKALKWIKKYAYTMRGRALNRGKGDATIATDTLSWSIAALGPQTLKQIQFDPEGIVAFAEENCDVTVSLKKMSGKIMTVRGFDFSKAQNVGRGGVISTEWTSQMIVTYQVLAKYFNKEGDQDKAALYMDKANLYLNELQKLIITSPSRTGQGRGCLPYASADNINTGHGWRTPKGRRTGSVSGTAYGIFAWVRYNPFSADNKIEIR